MKVVGGVVATLGFVWLAGAIAPVATAELRTRVATVQPRSLAAVIAQVGNSGREGMRADAEPVGDVAEVDEAGDRIEAATEVVADVGGESAADHEFPTRAAGPSDAAEPVDAGDHARAVAAAEAESETDIGSDIRDEAEPDSESDARAEPEAEAESESESDSEDETEADAAEAGRPAFELLGTIIPVGETSRLQWTGIQSFVGDTAASSPVLVAHGIKDGPVLCLTAAIHGDELNGIEIVRRVMHDLDATQLSGTVIGVPIVNVWGFQRASRYLPDRRDLNRYFPGDPRGSSASRIAHALMEGIIKRCDMLVDIHTGSFHRTNLTQLRADVSRADVRALCAGFGDMPVLQNVGSPGTLRRAATDAGVPTVTIEAGEPMRLEAKVVDRGVAGIMDLLAYTKMGKSRRFFGSPQPVFYRSTWVRSDSGGILFAKVSLGDDVDAGDELGVITDPMTNLQSSVRSPFNGTVLGMAVNQFVMPGFAVFRVGIETSGEELGKSSPPTTLGSESPLGELAPIGPNVDLDERPE